MRVIIHGRDSVAHWPPAGRAVVSNVDHPIMRGLGVKPGDSVPGPWAGEADMIYEPEFSNGQQFRVDDVRVFRPVIG
jgi:hypothetical protein